MPEDTAQATNPTNDAFERYYAEKLWEWVPAVYRHEDGLADPPHTLRGIIEVLACQAAVARRSIDRLWEDQFIHFCDDWAVSYIGELLGTRLIGALNRRGRRVDVAKTLFYRRRKGTPVVMESLIQDITGWEGVVVESFKRLARTRHRLDPEPNGLAGPITATPPGGTAKLKGVRISDILDGPFDDLAHTADFRRLRGHKGRYNIPKLNFHIYRLMPFEVNFATPFDLGSERFTVDPSGRDIPLFRPSKRGPESGCAQSEEWMLPDEISCRLYNSHKPRLAPDALAITIDDEPDDAPLSDSELHAANLTSWAFPAGLPYLALVDPHSSRLALANPLGATDNLYVPRYHYGFVGNVGAGTFDRSLSVRTESITPFPDGGNAPGPVTGFPLPNDGAHSFTNSKTYRPDAPLNNATVDIEDLWLQANDRERPYLTLAPSDDETEWAFVAAPKTDDDDSRCLVLEGIWVGMLPTNIPDQALADPDEPVTPVETILALDGEFDRVVIRHCTLDPGGERSRLDPLTCAPIPSIVLEIRGHVEELLIESSIVGAIREAQFSPPAPGDEDPGCSIGKLILRDSIVQSLLPSTPAIFTRVGEATLERVTIFGDVTVNRLDATETIIQGSVRVLDNQRGCFRFSATDRDPTRRLPRQFESHLVEPRIPNHYFTSVRFGDPGFAQLSKTCPDELFRGAENRSEMGAFSNLLDPVKRSDLRLKIIEFMPFGLIPQLIFET